jgi:hypothetical protein
VCTIVKYQLSHVSLVSSTAEPSLHGHGAPEHMPLLQVQGLQAAVGGQGQPRWHSGQITSWDFHKKAECPYK